MGGLGNQSSHSKMVTKHLKCQKVLLKLCSRYSCCEVRSKYVKEQRNFEFFQIMGWRREFIFVSFHSSRSTPQGGDYQALPINSVTFIVEISHCVWHRRTPLWCARGTTQRSHPAAKAYSVKNEEFKHRVSATSVCSSTTPAGGRCAGPNKHIQKSSAVFNTHITKPTRFKGNLLQNFA
jgi:hypothetical protein